MNINTNRVIQFCIPFLGILLLSYFLSAIIFYSLPKSGIEFVKKGSSDLKYENYNLSMFFNKAKKQQKIVRKVVKSEYKLLSQLSLNAVYAKSDQSGWVIIKEKSSSKTHILAQGESFKNYKLKYLFPSYIIFEKNSKEYKLAMKQLDKKFEVITQQNKTSSWSEKIVVGKDKVLIKRKFLDNYVNDLEKVWNDVKIDEVKKNGFITGFKISNISSGSTFSKLGLLKGDIITQVNNTKLNNYNKAFKIYKEIKNMKYLNIEILRKNRQMELSYEIN